MNILIITIIVFGIIAIAIIHVIENPPRFKPNVKKHQDPHPDYDWIAKPDNPDNRYLTLQYDAIKETWKIVLVDNGNTTDASLKRYTSFNLAQKGLHNLSNKLKIMTL